MGWYKQHSSFAENPFDKPICQSPYRLGAINGDQLVFRQGKFE